MVVLFKGTEIVVGGEMFDGSESVYWIAKIVKVTGTNIYFKFPGYDPADGRTEYWEKTETVREWQTRYVNDVVAGNDICVKTTKNGRETNVALLQSFEAEVEEARKAAAQVAEAAQAAAAQAVQVAAAAAGGATPGKVGCSKCKGLTACGKCNWKTPAGKKKTPSKA